jgi:DNA polymerase III subunit delta'
VFLHPQTLFVLHSSFFILHSSFFIFHFSFLIFISPYLCPMPFSDVIGQHEVKQHLAEMVQHNRLSHALLFLGKEGSGALPLAIAFAQFVVCEKVQGKHTAIAAGPSLFGDAPEPASSPLSIYTDACGQCAACTKAQQLVHPDIHFSYPVIPRKSGDKPLSTDYASEWREFIKQSPYGNVYDWLQFIGAENKQGNITAHECNEIIRKLSLKSFESEYKILVMWMPEYLGNEGNKLLKLIEEPPPNTLFILVAESESQILPTILSRTQLVKVPALLTEEVQEALQQRSNLGETQARQVASVSEGNYREALQLLQHAGDDWQDLLREWLNAILKTGPVAQVKWVEEMNKLGRERQKQFLRYFNHLLEQAIRLAVMGANRVNMPEKEYDFALRLNKLADIARQQAIIQELDKASYYIERNANGKMLFHALTIKIYYIIKDNSLILMD